MYIQYYLQLAFQQDSDSKVLMTQHIISVYVGNIKECVYLQQYNTLSANISPDHTQCSEVVTHFNQSQQSPTM